MLFVLLRASTLFARSRWTFVFESAGVVLAGIVLAAALTYPVAFQIDRVGRLNTDDGRWSIWVVAWVAQALTSDPASLFDANIFYPERRTLAYSEANLLAGAVGAPVWYLTRNPYTTYNAVFLFAFVLAFAAMYALARYLVHSRGAAAIAAVLFAFCPYVFARTAHVQLLFIGTLPLVLLAMHRLVDAPSVRRAVILGVTLWIAALGCGYYGIFAALLVSAGCLWFAWTRGRLRDGRYWGACALAAYVSIGLTLPFLLPYLDTYRDGFARTLQDAEQYSASWAAFGASAAWAHRWWLPWLGDHREVLFPGLSALAFGLTGVWLLRHREWYGSGRRDVGLFYAGIAVVGVWLAFGPAGGLYAVLYEVVPAFAFLRAPARAGVLTTLALCVLAAAALCRLLERVRRPRLAALAIGTAAVAELSGMPLTQFRQVAPTPPAYGALSQLPRGPVAAFPYWTERADLPRHAYYMLHSTAHWQPLVNGYSDHMPRRFMETRRQLGDFPSDDALWILRDAGARYVALHLYLYGDLDRQRLLERLASYEGRPLRPLVREGDVWLFELAP